MLIKLIPNLSKYVLHRAIRSNLVSLHYIRNSLFTGLGFVQTCPFLTISPVRLILEVKFEKNKFRNWLKVGISSCLPCRQLILVVV